MAPGTNNRRPVEFRLPFSLKLLRLQRVNGGVNVMVSIANIEERALTEFLRGGGQRFERPPSKIGQHDMVIPISRRLQKGHSTGVS